jgi:diguanylate cyclase
VRSLFIAVVAMAVLTVVVTPETWLGQVAYTAGFIVVTAAAWYGAAHADQHRLPWALVAGALTSWLVGDIVDQGLTAAGIVFDGGPQDVFWLLGYPLLGGGLIVMVRLRGARQGGAALIDGFAMSTAAAAAAWELYIAPQLTGTGPLLLVALAASYPLGDVVLLAALLFLVLSPGTRGGPTRLLLAALTLTLVTDVALTLLPDVWTETDVSRLNGALLLANALLAAAACHPDRAELTTPAAVRIETLHPARVLFLTVALLTAPLLAISRGSLPPDERVLLLIAAVVTSGLGVARFTVAVRQQERMQRLLLHQASHDTLTGLTNRRVLDEHLDDLFDRSDKDVMMLYVDLDGFKAVNDAHGHAAGDSVLATVAARIVAQVRSTDIVTRLGGDEFAVLCHGLDAADAQRLAERICEVVAYPIPIGRDLVHVGASVGIATAIGRATPHELLHAADDAMFSAKRQGSGRWVAATPA